MRSQAGTAAGVHNNGARLRQNSENSLLVRLAPHLPGGGEHEHAHILVYPLPLENPRRHLKVLHTPIRAGAEEHLIYLYSLRLVYVVHIIHGVRKRNLRNQIRGVVLVSLLVLRVLIRVENLVGSPGSPLQVRLRLIVSFNYPVLGAHLRAHVCEDHPRCDTHILYCLPLELHRLVHGTARGDIAYDVQRQVLRVHALRHLPVHNYLVALWHAEPYLARGPDCGDLTSPDSSGESAECAGRGGVRISTHNHCAGQIVALLRHHLMTNPCVYVPEVLNALLLHEFPDALVVVRIIRRGRGHGVVKDDHDFLRVPHPLNASLLEFQEYRRRVVVAHHPGGLHGNYLSGSHFLLSSLPREDFLREGHPHNTTEA